MPGHQRQESGRGIGQGAIEEGEGESQGGSKMNRKIIRVPDWDAAEMEDLLTVGSDAGGLGQNDYTIEKIGEPFTDDEGRKVVEITLVERTK